MNSTQGKNYNSLDLFKFIMAVFVVCIHTFPWGKFSDNIIVDIFDMLTTIAVPFFFLTSGFILARKFKDSYASETNQRIVFNRFKQMVKMYLIWTAVYLPLGIYDYVRNDYSFFYSIAITLRKIAFRGENFNSWMLWYLLSTIYALLFVWVTMKLKCKSRYLPVFSAFFFILISIINKIAWSEQSLPSFLEIIKTLIKYTITDGRVLTGFVFIPLGIFISLNQKIIKYAAFLTFPCFAGMLIEKDSWYYSLVSAFFYIGFFCLVLRINLKDSGVYLILRKSSKIIYFTHMYVYSIFCFISYQKIIQNIPSFVFTVIVCPVIAIAYSLIKARKRG